MPLFKSTYNILTKPDEDEVWNDNWMDSDTLVLPPKTAWTYDRELQLEDVDIWEQLAFHSGIIGVYASWAPYAEFYLITYGNNFSNSPKTINGAVYWDKHYETFYGPEAQQKVYKRAKEFGVDLHVHKTWVDPDKLWLHQLTNA